MPRSGSATAPRRSRTTPCARSSGPSGWTRPAACRRTPSRILSPGAARAVPRRRRPRLRHRERGHRLRHRGRGSAGLPLFHRQFGDDGRAIDGGRLAGPRHGAAARLAHRRIGPGGATPRLALARLGHHVTVVDIEPHFCELIRRRAARKASRSRWCRTTSSGPSAAAEALRRRAVLRMLPPLRRPPAPAARAAGGGGAGRPRLLRRRAHHPRLPMPWGLRLDRQSLWAIRENGWLELGFRDDYFARGAGRMRLVRAAPRLRRSRLADPVGGTAARPAGVPRRRRRHAAQHRQRPAEGDAILLEGAAGTGLFGPYITLPAGTYLARLRFRAGAPARGRARMDVACNTGRHPLAERRSMARRSTPRAAP